MLDRKDQEILVVELNMVAVDAKAAMFNKILLLLIKYIPIIQMIAMLSNNTIYYFTNKSLTPISLRAILKKKSDRRRTAYGSLI